MTIGFVLNHPLSNEPGNTVVAFASGLVEFYYIQINCKALGALKMSLVRNIVNYNAFVCVFLNI